MQVIDWHDKNKSIKHLVDKKLELNDNEVRQVREVVKIALLCVQTEPEPRPSMNFVLACLEGRAKFTLESRMHTKVNRNINIGANQPLPMGEPNTSEITEGIEMPLRSFEGPWLNSSHYTQEQ
jgi:hypothetical protein